jgi:redox-sensitive bicupin YhaK (pirin superfamily)
MSVCSACTRFAHGRTCMIVTMTFLPDCWSLLQARGHADLGWLNSYHTFSFSNYQSAAYDHFHSLRVINEDRVKGGEGFGTHPHANFEIFSYVVSGALRHEDSIGNLEVLRRGDVQFTSAGSGISHSEYNDHASELVHFIQIWVVPDRRGLKPTYDTKRFTDAEKMNNLRLILSPSGANNSIILHQDMHVYACLLHPGAEVSFDLPAGREAFVHLIQDVTGYASELQQTRLQLNGAQLKGGDGAYVRHAASATVGSRLKFKGTSMSDAPAEFLLFDMKKTGEHSHFG